MAKYRKRPVVVEAMGPLSVDNSEWIAAWSGALKTSDLNWDYWMGNYVTKDEEPIVTGIGGFQPDGSLILIVDDEHELVALGDFVIKSVENEFYPCRPDIFEATYEPVGASD